MVHKALVIVAVLFVGAIAYFSYSGKINTQKTGSNTPLATESSSNSNNNLSSAPLPVSETLINEALAIYAPNVLKAEYGGKVFCSHYLYGYDEERQKNEVLAYVWAYCEEYYKDGQGIKMGSGVSMPIKVLLELQNGKLGVQGHEVPEDGEGYAASIKAMFPDKYAAEAIAGYNVDKFSPTPKAQAEEYFK